MLVKSNYQSAECLLLRLALPTPEGAREMKDPGNEVGRGSKPVYPSFPLPARFSGCENSLL